MLAAVKTALRRLRRWLSARLDRGCARPSQTAGRDGETALRSNKETGSQGITRPKVGGTGNVTVTIDNRRRKMPRQRLGIARMTPAERKRRAAPARPHNPDIAGATHAATAQAVGRGGSGAHQSAGRISRLAGEPPAQSRGIEAGGEATSDCRARPRGAADDRPTTRLRPRLKQEVLDRHDPITMAILLNLTHATRFPPFRCYGAPAVTHIEIATIADLR
jgi:hypothetical protein